jgi:hypothetical protein
MPEGTAVPAAAVAIRAPVATRPSGSTVEDANFYSLRLIGAPMKPNQPAEPLTAAENDSLQGSVMHLQWRYLSPGWAIMLICGGTIR